MAKLQIRKLVLTAALFQGFFLFCLPAAAQNSTARASSLMRDGMDAYSNLDLDTAKSLLDQAVALGPQLDMQSLARVYASLGVLWTGGYSDNAQGQKNFVLALCLDPAVMIDPLFSSPDIDIIFTLSRSQATPDKCPAMLQAAGIRVGGGAAPVVPVTSGQGGPPPCGNHMALAEQKRKFELPFFLELDPGMAAKVKRLKVFYAFDAAANYNELAMMKKGSGYGALLDCDRGQVRIYDPSTVAYYIAGYDTAGRLVCGHGSKTAPLEVLMLPDGVPLSGIGGMLPKECLPCPPWDETCGKTSFLQALGEPCQPDLGCEEGMRCGDLGICELVEGADKGPVRGPSKFYVDLMAGVGVGYQKQEIEVREIDDTSHLSVRKQTPAGFAFGGVPIRLNIGFYLTENFSLEIAGRFDPTFTGQKVIRSCYDSVNDKLEPVENPDSESTETTYDAAETWGVAKQYCGGEFSNQSYLDTNGDGLVTETELKAGVATGKDFTAVLRANEVQIDWMAALRARYRVVQRGGLGISLFLGLGYGQFTYNVPAEGGGTTYFPSASGLVVELGPQLAYYFNDSVGIVFGLPIDFVFLDGFALNFDPSLGLSFGF